MLKKTVTISLFLAGVIAAGILAAGLVVYNSNKSQQSAAGNISPVNNLAGANNGTPVVLNLVEVAKHNNSSSCWMVISGKVYDVTTAISSHPGGAGNILSSCGKDATAAFQTKDKSPGKNHSGMAYSMLNSYYIGDLNQKIN
jgi:cytochrome b involved in lipid metabolism